MTDEVESGVTHLPEAELNPDRRSRAQGDIAGLSPAHHRPKAPAVEPRISFTDPEPLRRIGEAVARREALWINGVRYVPEEQ